MKKKRCTKGLRVVCEYFSLMTFFVVVSPFYI